MYFLPKKTLFVVAMVASSFSVVANASDVISVQSCVSNQNLDEQGLSQCLDQVINTAKAQVYSLTTQGDDYQHHIDTQCHKEKLAVDNGAVKSLDRAQVAMCYANAWSTARDTLLNEKTHAIEKPLTAKAWNEPRSNDLSAQ